MFVALLVLIENEAMYYFSIVVLLYTLYFLVNNVLPISLWIGCGYVVGKAIARFTTYLLLSTAIWLNLVKIGLKTKKNYAQALHIDWAIFQNCPINVKIYGTFLGQFQNCPINVEDYPINVKCLRIPYRQAFHIDWAVFLFLDIFWHF